MRGGRCGPGGTAMGCGGRRCAAPATPPSALSRNRSAGMRHGARSRQAAVAYDRGAGAERAGSKGPGYHGEGRTVSLPWDAVADSVRSRLRAAAGKARHPDLALWRFVADMDVLPDGDEISEDGVPAGEREPAELRRAALLVAAADVVDRCIDDLQLIEFGDDHRPDADETADSFICEWFPGRHRDAYDEDFFRKVMVTAVQVAADLGDPLGGPASCTAEEIVRHAVGVIAGELCEAAGLGRPWLDPDEYLLEDADFEFLYGTDMDGLENDPGMQAALNVDVPPVQDWFSPFNSSRVVHPYTETPSSAPVLHDLHDLHARLGPGGDPSVVLAPGVVDAAAPVASFVAGSEIVALARQAAAPGDGQWVADEADPERSFAALVTAAAAGEGSGWLGWEPHDGADCIRTDPVIAFTAHRHFPVGEDEPWVHASVGGGRFLAIPLRFIVSYRPDPQIRRRWERPHGGGP